MPESKYPQLVYQRAATKARDGGDGFLYCHVWRTGYDLLVFSDHAAAAKWAAAEDAELINVPVICTPKATVKP